MRILVSKWRTFHGGVHTIADVEVMLMAVPMAVLGAVTDTAAVAAAAVVAVAVVSGGVPNSDSCSRSISQILAIAVLKQQIWVQGSTVHCQAGDLV